MARLPLEKSGGLEGDDDIWFTSCVCRWVTLLGTKLEIPTLRTMLLCSSVSSNEGREVYYDERCEAVLLDLRSK
jgi:hypothetical protein